MAPETISLANFAARVDWILSFDRDGWIKKKLPTSAYSGRPESERRELLGQMWDIARMTVPQKQNRKKKK
jgi:hypothetical protein